jgi:hypothetical protein
MVPLPSSAIPADGDVNGDGQVDAADALLILRIVQGYFVPGAEQERRADIAPVGQAPENPVSVNPADAMLMNRAMAGEDVDGDGLDTQGENAIGSSPFLDDTDGDGHSDAIDPDALVPTPPNDPGGLRVADAPGSVAITWAAPAEDVDFYIVHRYGTNGEYSFEIVEGPAASYLDGTVAEGPVYLYWLQAVNALGQQSAFVDCNVADPENDRLWLTGAWGPIANPWFSATSTPGEIALTWEQSSNPSVIGYRVWLSSTVVSLGSTEGLVHRATVDGIGSTTHTLTGLPPGTYWVRVTAFSAGSESRLDSARQLAVQVP